MNSFISSNLPHIALQPYSTPTNTATGFSAMLNHLEENLHGAFQPLENPEETALKVVKSVINTVIIDNKNTSPNKSLNENTTTKKNNYPQFHANTTPSSTITAANVIPTTTQTTLQLALLNAVKLNSNMPTHASDLTKNNAWLPELHSFEPNYKRYRICKKTNGNCSIVVAKDQRNSPSLNDPALAQVMNDAFNKNLRIDEVIVSGKHFKLYKE